MKNNILPPKSFLVRALVQSLSILVAFFIIIYPIVKVFAEEETIDQGNQVVNNGETNIQSGPQIEQNLETLTEDFEENPILNSNTTKKARLTTDVDNSTGAMIYKYSINVPPGRNKMTPDVTLMYNSSNSVLDSVIGSGWSIDIPSIERINKTGSQELFSEDYYSSSLSGELIALDSTNYRAKDELGDFIKYEKSGSGWVVTSKDGTQYIFGANAQARQDDPNNSSHIYKWMLEEVRDTNDNYISYTYYKDAGQIYPLQIVYTGNGTTDGIFEVNFTTASRTGGPISYSTGFSVKSNYVISEINTKINSVWAEKYDFTYTTADNGTGSLLETIIESGQDGSNNVTVLPATDFDYKTSTANWTYDSTWSLAVPLQFLLGIPTKDYGTRTADINGDGLPDFICANNFAYPAAVPCSINAPKIYLNTGSGWTDVSSTWTMPDKVDSSGNKEYFINSSYQNQGLELIDVNGDNLTDLVRAGNDGLHYVYLNNGSGWTYNSTWSSAVPMQFLLTGSNFRDQGVRTADINGDGLPDFVCANNIPTGGAPSQCHINDPKIYLNNGSGWTDVSSTWTMPDKIDSSGNKEYFVISNYQVYGLQLIDVNGDNLADLVRAGNDELHYVYLNNGSGWTYDSTWSASVPMQFVVGPPNRDYGVRMTDINGDGLPDFVCANDFAYPTAVPCSINAPKIYLNNGSGWTDVSSTWTMPDKVDSSGNKEFFIQSNYQNHGLQLIDVNGDNLVDLVRAGSDGLHYVYLNNTTNSRVNNLTQITYPEGGNTQITYKATQLFKDGSSNLLNPNLPMSIDVVSQITNNDGLGNSETNNYSYQGGKYYFDDYLTRKFAGFASTSVTDDVGNVKKTYFHQGDGTNSSLGEYSDSYAKIGKPYRVEQYDGADNLYADIINKWDSYNIGTGHDFVKLTRTTTLTYDGTNNHKDTAQEYTYDDTNGNLTQKIDWGEVTGSSDGSFADTGNDMLTESFSYASDGENVIGLLSDDIIQDQNATTIQDTRTYYDELTFGTTGAGNPTEIEKMASVTRNVNTQKSYYTTYGIPITSTDERGKTTSYSYDTYHLYPTTITDPLSNSTEYTYDYSTGKVIDTTDPNGLTKETTYDGLGRVLTEKIPDLTSPSTLDAKTAYVYTDTSNAVSVQKVNYLNSSTTANTYQYFDGLGRLIQERKEAETSGNFNVKDTVYNNLGLVQKESLPYTGSGSSKTSPTTTTALYTTYAYDPVQRIHTLTNASGVTAYSYTPWEIDVSDPRGKVKNYYYDAYKNLVRVDERTGSYTYSTYYTWNLNGNLINTTDALGNVRNFTYDNLGHRLTAEDLHAQNDATYGTWAYTYDDSGNLTESINPNGDTVDYTYDDVNRKLTEDSTGTTGTDIIYTYDSCSDGIGKLCSAVMLSGVETDYTYDADGNVASEEKTVTKNIYTTSYTHDRQSNMLVITYPDNAQVLYVYNSAGLLEKIEYKESGGSFTDVISNFDYAPTDQPTEINYANRVTTTNTYDPNNLYRVTDKSTTNQVPTSLQKTTYEYDADGNITEIVDDSSTSGSKTADYTYDDLNRLTSATITDVPFGQTPYTQNFTYNAIGNITSGPVGSYTYAGNSGTNYANPHAATSINSVTNTYDHNGNNTDDGTLTNTWNYKNQLTETTNGTFTREYLYDEQGNRVLSSNGTLTTEYPNQYYNYGGSKKTKNIYAGNQLVSTIETANSVVTPYYIHPDHLGSTNVVSDSNGGQVELLDYYPFGSQRISSGSHTNQKQYIGQHYDPDTSLNYLNARYHQSTAGRFISEDPVFWNPDKFLNDPQQLNSYSYARNNPIILSDPSGKWFGEYLSGTQSWNNFSGEVGQAAQYMGGGWQMAMDHPYATGAAIGVVGGATAVGGAMIAGSSVASTVANTLFNSQAVVRGTINTTFNVGSQILEDQMQNKQTSFGDYAKIVGLSYAGGAMTGPDISIKFAMGIAGATNLSTQVATGDHSVNPVKVAGSILGSGFGSWVGSFAGSTLNLGTYAAQQYGLSKIGWTVEAPMSIISSGTNKKK